MQLNKLIKYIDVIFLLLLSSALRLVNLGYSDYQGDEIKALFLPENNQSFFSFLMDQRKGPLQFFITYILKFIDHNYQNEFLIRLLFAIAGVLSVLFFYKLLNEYFGKKVAFYASLFMATNGFFVAFSRIVQYQSFVILFAILSLYFFTLSNSKSNWKIKGIYLGFICWALSVLAHYDGFFIAPFAGYILFSWLKTNGKAYFKHLFLAGVVFVAILSAFYVPFVMSLSKETLDYWQNRVTGGDGKISSSFYLFQVYNPIYTIHVYYILGILGAIFAITQAFLPAIFVAGWFLVPFLFMELAINIPGTHIFNYLIPAFVFIGFGFLLLEKLTHFIFKERLGRLLTLLGVVFITLFISAQSYFIFVDNTLEYPWENEKFLIWTFHKPSAIFHLSMFGFPYSRNWEEISQFISSNRPDYPCPKNSLTPCVKKEFSGIYYSTNERRSIVRYYLPFDRGTDNASYYVYIVNPQSFTEPILNEKAAWWTANYEPIKVISEGSKVLAKIYYMPAGNLDELKQDGY